jgi:IclR family transcriptional regulator, pca regulon regulatory protein
MPEARPDYVQSLERGLAVLTSFSGETPALTLSDVARRTGLTRATARRLLLTLEELGYVGSDGRLFRLRPKTLCIGYAYLSSLPVAEIAVPYMEELSTALHESSSAAILDGEDIVYIARVPAKRIMSVGLAVGSRLPAHATSMGRVLLAALEPARLDAFLDTATLAPITDRTVTDPCRLREILDQTRRRGWALVDQELEDGVRSIAAPLRDGSARPVAALNCSAHAGRVTLERLAAEFVPRLLDAAERISAALGAR